MNSKSNETAASFPIGSWLRLAARIFTLFNAVYFALYFLVFPSDKPFSEAIAEGGPLRISFAVWVGLLSFAAAAAVRWFFKRQPKSLFLRLADTFCCWFASLFYLFFLINQFAILFGGLSVPETSNGTDAYLVPDAGHVLLNGTSFRMLIAIAVFSLFAAAATAVLRSETIGSVLRYTLHGGILIAAATGVNLLLLDGFSSLLAFLLFLIFAIVAESVYSVLHRYYKKEAAEKKEPDYRSIFQ